MVYHRLPQWKSARNYGTDPLMGSQMVQFFSIPGGSMPLRHPSPWDRWCWWECHCPSEPADDPRIEFLKNRIEENILNKDDLSDKSPSDDLYRISVPEWLPWCTLGLVVLGPSRFHGLIFQWSRRNKMTSGWNGGVGVQPKEHKSWCEHLNLIATIKEMMQVLFATSCEVPEKRLPCSTSHCGLHHQVSINIWKVSQGPQGPQGTSAAPVAALVTGTASVTGMGSVATPGTDQLGMNRPEKRVKMSEAWWPWW